MFHRKTNFHYHRVSPLQTHRCCFGPNSTISAFSWHRAVSFNIIRQNVIFSNNRSALCLFVWIYLCSNAHESELLLKVIPRKVVLIHVVPLITYLPQVLLSEDASNHESWLLILFTATQNCTQSTRNSSWQHAALDSSNTSSSLGNMIKLF